MASTALMSDSDEDARIIAHEQSIRLLQDSGRDKITWTLNASDEDAKAAAMILQQPAAKGSKSQDSTAELEIQGRCSSQMRRSPHSKRRASRHSRPWPAAKGSKSEDSATELEEAGCKMTLNASDGDAKAEGSKSHVKMTEEESIIVLDEIIRPLHAKNLQQPAAKGSKSQDSATTELVQQGLWEINNMYLRFQVRKRPPHSKRRASRHSRPWPAAKGPKSQDKMISSTLTEVINASDGDAEMETETEAMIVTQPPTKMVVKPMAPTAFMSDSDEEARIIAHEQRKPFVFLYI